MKKLSVMIAAFFISSITNASVGEWDEYTPNSLKYNRLIIDRIITPSSVEATVNSDAKTRVVVVKLKRAHDRIEVIQTPDLEINCEQELAVARLSNKYFQIKNRRNFELQAKIKCGMSNVWVFDAQSTQGQVMAINNIAQKAVKMMKERGLLSFWKKKVTLKWPADGDYYSWNTVHITRGDHWDIVGHELGHAIYDQAKIGSMGGGRHRIDECYSGALALSEGWASYFSAWLSIGLKDDDAKFEYLVKRRAPIRIENIPVDVCKGYTNEWRVTGFLWDLIDLNADGENSNLSFSNLWQMTLNSKFSNAKEMAAQLAVQMDPILLNIVWENNFLTKREY